MLLTDHDAAIDFLEESIGILYRITINMIAISPFVVLLLILVPLLCILDTQRLLPLNDSYFALEAVDIWTELGIFSRNSEQLRATYKDPKQTKGAVCEQ